MSFDSFFNPKSVAIVGASQQEGKVGYEILKNMIDAGFEGRIFPINPNAQSLQGLQSYPDLQSIGQTPELVIIIVPARIVPSIMQQCARVGVKAAIIITAGFKEVGGEGLQLEKNVFQIAKQAGIRLIGPNCLGLIVPANRINASFGGKLPAVGSIGYLSQSGALLTAILDMANASGIGFSKLVSIGNKVDVNELDVINALAPDPSTKVIAGYLESITDGDSFVREAEQISRKKPILLLKAGGTSAGAKAASSHTGSLAGSETAYECVFERAGIIRCDSIKSQFDYAQAFAYQPLPKGKRVAVITNAGGPGIMATDAIVRQGLDFAEMAEATVRKLAAVLPAAANCHNPTDVLGDALADRYEAALDIVLDDPNVDTVLVMLTPQAMTRATETAQAVVEIAHRKPGKPVLACFMGAVKIAEAVRILRRGKIPQIDSAEGAVATIRVMTDYVRWLARPKRVVKLFPVNRRKVETIIQRHLRQGAREIAENESKEILEAYGFVTPKGSIATTADQAAGIAGQLGFPVVLKIWSPDILHKSDVGGVQIGLKSEKEVRDAFDLMMYRIPKFKMNSFFIADNVRDAFSRGIGDYTPIFLSEIPAEFESGRIPVDVALISVTPPDVNGLCSLGVSVDIVKSAVANAKYVIAQVNERMPRTFGNSFLHVNTIDVLVPYDEDIVEIPVPESDETLQNIGQNIARLVEDGSTIECGIGRIPQALAEFLKDKKDLGVHTEMFSDWIIELVECGAITCAKKSLNRGKIVASFCMGSRRLYDYIDNNPFFEFYPTEYVNDVFNISQHEKMVGINVGLEIDLTGQVCADSLGYQFYSGIGGQVDFIRGSARSRGGKAIIAMASTAKDGTVSRIVPALTKGAGVVTTRGDVHYVVTEFGVAYLHGKSIRKRCMDLINIAHPRFRNELLQAAKAQKYIYEDQIELAWDQVPYPKELEHYETLRNGTQIFFRPVKPTDEPALAEMLYSLSERSVQTRYMTHTLAFPHKDVQRLTNIDYRQDISIVGTVPGASGDEIVAIAQYFLDPKTQAAEVAFIVQDEWQKKGMGTLLLNYITDIARKRGVKSFYARVLPVNKPMLAIFHNSGYRVNTEFDGDVYSISYDLDKKQHKE